VRLESRLIEMKDRRRRLMLSLEKKNGIHGKNDKDRYER
jgi:hypothetical protein